MSALEDYIVIPYVRLFTGVPPDQREPFDWLKQVVSAGEPLPFLEGSHDFGENLRTPVDVYQVKGGSTIELRFGLDLVAKPENFERGQFLDLRSVTVAYYELIKPGTLAALEFHPYVIKNDPLRTSNPLSRLVEIAGKEAVMRPEDFVDRRMERSRLFTVSKFSGHETMIETVFRSIPTTHEAGDIEEDIGFNIIPGPVDPTDKLAQLFEGANIAIKLQIK